MGVTEDSGEEGYGRGGGGGRLGGSRGLVNGKKRDVTSGEAEESEWGEG